MPVFEIVFFERWLIMYFKKMYFLLLFFILPIQQNNIFAQDFSIGLGVTIEHPPEIEYIRLQGSVRIHKVYLPITVKSKFRVIPEIAYWNVKYSFGENSLKYSVLHAGIGIYYFIPLEKTNVYFGPRTAFIDIHNPPENTSTIYISSKRDKIFGGTLGAEYELLKNFTLGFEIQYNYYEINPWDNRGYETIEIKRSIESVFVIAFHL